MSFLLKMNNNNNNNNKTIIVNNILFIINKNKYYFFLTCYWVKNFITCKHLALNYEYNIMKCFYLICN